MLKLFRNVSSLFVLLVCSTAFSKLDYFNKLILEKNKSYSDATRLSFRLNTLGADCGKWSLVKLTSCVEYHYLYEFEFHEELKDKKILFSKLHIRLQLTSNISQLRYLLDLAKLYGDSKTVSKLNLRIRELEYMEN